MSKVKQWIIGADSGCDIVVDAPAVSGRHCRLIQADTGYEIEDLNSTNGTWVNGERISARKRITPSDRVTLGQSESMPWPEEPSSAATRTITIGRLPDNDVVIDDPIISGRHAEVRIKDGKAVIRDLESRNGTSIGSSDRRIESAPIKSGDIVFFGTLSFRAADLIEPDTKIEALQATLPVSALPRDVIDAMPHSTGGSQQRNKPWIFAVVIGGPILLVIAVVFGLFAGDGNEPEKEEPGADNPPTVAAAPVDPETALYWVLVKDAEEATTFRVGTAVAIGKRHLLTSGSIIKAIATLKDDFPKVTVFCPNTEKQFLVDVGKLKSHPAFDNAYETARSASRNYEQAAERIQQLAEEIGRLEKPGAKSTPTKSDKDFKQRIAKMKEQITNLGKDLRRWDDAVLVNSERATCYDLGVLELTPNAKSIPGHLAVSLQNSEHQGGNAVVVLGIPFPADSPLLTKYTGHRSQKISGRIKMLKRLDPKSTDPFRLVISSEQNLAADQWAGAVVLNVDGRVIGILSRLTPNNAGKPPQGDLFDAPLATRLMDFHTVDAPSE